jgi:hypothetical protein
MKIKKTIALVCLCGAAVMVSQGAMASGLKVRGGLTSNDYTLDYTPTGSSSTVLAKSSYSGNNLGLTWLSDDSSVYLDYARASGSGTFTRSYTTPGTYTSDFKRSDDVIILGVNTINAGGSVGNFYVGWKDGVTSLGVAPNASATGTNKYAYDLKTSGLVFGGGLGLPAAGGSIGLSLGMGLMSMREINTTTSQSWTADNAFGFSYGIGYTYAFTPNVGASVDYKGNYYTYTFDSGLSSEYKFSETFTTAGASVYVKF